MTNLRGNSVLTFANGDPNSSTAYFSLNQCYLNSLDNSFMDYSEFTADTNENLFGPSIFIVSDNLYSANTSVNHYSCTLGVGDTLGMCLTVVDDCELEYVLNCSDYK